ncbi:MAG: carotenoid oxygenase family protein [Cyanobacteria bacterium P01_D01_bin.156]
MSVLESPTSSLENQPTWQQSIAQPAKEFPLTPLPVLSGKLPSGLRGSLYRNGPGRLERGGQQVGHWFDGDGAILGVHFTGTDASGVYRYVKTDIYNAEEQTERFIGYNYGTYPPGNYWQRMTAPLKNAANTSVMAATNRLLTLWEAGSPYALDLQTLETQGLDNLGSGNASFCCSAHPKRDPITGDIFNFGVAVSSPRPKLMLYRISPQGQIKQQKQHELGCFTIIHDFLMAGPYLVVIVPPLRAHLPSLLLRLKTFSHCLQWKPELGTQILVFDRDTFELVSRNTVEPWFNWHVGNGCVDSDGQIVVDMPRLDNWDSNQRLAEVVTGDLKTEAFAYLHRLRIDPATARVTHTEQLSDFPCEFLTVNPTDVGQPWRYTYLNVNTKSPDAGRDKDWFNAIGRMDYQTGELTVSNLDDGYYPVEAIYAGDAENDRQGWILTVVYNGSEHRSEVWVFDSDRIDDDPVCRLGLPEVIPLSFHGTWRPAV